MKGERTELDDAQMYARTQVFLEEALGRDLPDELSAHAKLVILDTLGVMVRGYAEPDVARLAANSPEEGDAWLYLNPRRRANASRAILCHAAAVASLELSEGNRYAKGHIALQVLPALLAFTDRGGVDGTTFVRSFVLGYEIAARMARASKRHFMAYGHGIYAAAGSAVAVAAAQGRSAAEIVECLKVASNLSLAPAFVTHFEGATVRNLTAGFGGAMGYQVPELVDAGFTGSEGAMAITLGRHLGSAFSQAAFVQGMGTDYLIDANYFKAFASGRHMHAATEALASILAGGVVAADIASIRVETYYPASMMSNTAPINALAAKTSIPYCLAALAVLGHNRVEAFEVDALHHPDVIDLMPRIEVAEDDARSAVGGWAQDTASPVRSAHVVVTLRSGGTLEATCDRTTGDHDAPLPRNEVLEKYAQLTRVILGEGASDGLRDLVLSLEQSADVGASLADLLD